MSYTFAVFLTIFIVLIYILLAGFRAVLITDIIQSFVIIILLILVTFWITGSMDIGTLLSVQTNTIDFGTAFGFFLFGLLFTFSIPNVYQLCYAAKDKKKLRRGIFLAVLPIFFVTFLILLIGLFMASQSPGLDTGLVFTEALKNFLQHPYFL